MICTYQKADVNFSMKHLRTVDAMYWLPMFNIPLSVQLSTVSMIQERVKYSQIMRARISLAESLTRIETEPPWMLS